MASEDVVVIISSDEEDQEGPSVSRPPTAVAVVKSATPTAPVIATTSTNSNNGVKWRGGGNIEEITLSDDEEQASTSNGNGDVQRNQLENGEDEASGSSSETKAKRESLSGSIASGGIENEDEIARQVLLDDDQKSEVSQIDKNSDLAKELTQLLKVVNVKGKAGTGKDYKKLEAKVWKKHNMIVGELKDQPTKLFKELCRRVELVRKYIVEHPEHSIWKYFNKLFHQFSVDALTQEFVESSLSDDQLSAEQAKQKKLKALEKLIVKHMKKVDKLDEEEIDWDRDDDHNTVYLQRDRLMKTLDAAWNAYCRGFGYSKLTGRPVQKAISLKNLTRYPELERSVEMYVNKRGYANAPSYLDIYNIVTTTNTDDKLHISETDLREEARILLQAIIDRRQFLRALDFRLALPSKYDAHLAGTSRDLQNLNDPAQEDEELARKLEENAKSAKTLKAVADAFARLQEERQQDGEPERETGDNCGSDNEDDDETEERVKEHKQEDEEDEEEETDEEDSEVDMEEIRDINASLGSRNVDDDEESCSAGDEPLCDLEDEEAIFQSNIQEENTAQTEHGSEEQDITDGTAAHSDTVSTVNGKSPRPPDSHMPDSTEPPTKRSKQEDVVE